MYVSPLLEVHMNATAKLLLSLGFLAVLSIGCSTEPEGDNAQAKLNDNTTKALDRLNAEDPGLQSFLSHSYGYVIFPTVGKGGLILGGSYGRGQVYDQGAFVGYADITQATIGAQIGGQSFTEMLAFENEASLQRFEAGKFAFDATASAVALKSGAAATAKYSDGVAAFIEPQAGLMLEAAIGGQSFKYQPK
jgi:lipid-binding SYLF domain-containing protein